MTTKTILVDDIRDIDADVICRNFAAAKIIFDLISLTEWSLLLDHDLGESKSGYDLINHLIDTKNIPKRVFIVSSNPVGRDNIGRAIMDTGEYRKLSPMEFVRVSDE